MRIMSQEAKLLSVTPDALFLIERCGRVCYKSEERLDCGVSGCHNGQLEDGSVCSDCLNRASMFVRKLIRSGHESVLEHASATFLLITDRGISHEIVRHRIGVAYSQESTRYCNYGTQGEITVIAPSGGFVEPETWEQSVRCAEKAYMELLRKRSTPQFARSVLPTCLKTEIAMTANFRAWRHILKLRAENKRAHPQIRELMGMVLRQLQENVSVVFDDISIE